MWMYSWGGGGKKNELMAARVQQVSAAGYRLMWHLISSELSVSQMCRGNIGNEAPSSQPCWAVRDLCLPEIWKSGKFKAENWAPTVNWGQGKQILFHPPSSPQYPLSKLWQRRTKGVNHNLPLNKGMNHGFDFVIGGKHGGSNHGRYLAVMPLTVENETNKPCQLALLLAINSH